MMACGTSFMPAFVNIHHPFVCSHHLLMNGPMFRGQTPTIQARGNLDRHHLCGELNLYASHQMSWPHCILDFGVWRDPPTSYFGRVFLVPLAMAKDSNMVRRSTFSLGKTA